MLLTKDNDVLMPMAEKLIILSRSPRGVADLAAVVMVMCELLDDEEI